MKELKILRARLDLTQSALGVILGVSQQYISLLESDKTQPSKKVLNRIYSLMEGKR
jgi:transcriptional regulator with XRE-family HTH domain